VRDSGLWNVTSLIGAPVTSGNLYVQRTGETLWLLADALRLGEVSGTFDLLPSGTLPSGLRPSGRSCWTNLFNSAGQLRRLAVSPAGWVPLYFAAPNDVLHFTVSVPVSGDFPTSYPGVKV
jgi:hypothetical protein